MRPGFSFSAGRVAAVFAAGLLGGSLGAIHSYHTDTTVVFEVEAKSSVPSIAQVFFDVGRGFNEKDSQSLPVAGTDHLQKLDFPLPHERIYRLRFDPLLGPGVLVIHRMEILNGAHRVIISFEPERLIPVNETRVQPLPDGALVEAVPNAHDPITMVPLDRPVVSRVNAYADAVWWGLPWLVVASCAALILTTRSVSARWSTAGGGLVRFLSTDPAAPAGSSFPHRRTLLLSFFTLIVVAHVVRAPRLFIDPRFWAEEGNVWFQNALTHSPLSTLLFIFPDSGYSNLFANLSAELASVWASWFGLEYAPLVTTICALSVQLLCFVFILCGRSRLADEWWKRLLGCLIILFSPVAFGEIWLNSINSMSYLGLVAVLVLFQDPTGWTTRTRWAVRCILVLCGLTGVYSAVLFPLFLLAFLLYKNREHLYQGVILALCLAVQVATMLVVRSGAGLQRSRFSQITLDSALVNIFFNEVATPFLGTTRARVVFHWFGMDSALAAAAAVPRGSGLLLPGWFSFLVIALLFWVLCQRMTRVKALLVCCFILYAVLTAAASLNGLPVSRYSFLPGTILLLLLVVAVASAPANWMRVAWGTVLALSLSYGLTMYRLDPNFSVDQWGAPSWSSEVAEWRRNSTHPLRMWPSWWAGRIYYAPPHSP